MLLEVFQLLTNDPNIVIIFFFESVQIAAWEAMDPDDRPQNFLPKKFVVDFIYRL